MPPVTAAINELAGTLGYLPVDADWGDPGPGRRPARPGHHPRPGRAVRQRAARPGPGRWKNPCGPGSTPLASGSPASGRRAPTEKFLIVSRTATGGGETQWLPWTSPPGPSPSKTRTTKSQRAMRRPTVTTSPGASWAPPRPGRRVLSGQLNLHAALRHNDLRYCPAGTDSPVASQTRIAMLADLLGLGAWAQADAARPDARGGLVT